MRVYQDVNPTNHAKLTPLHIAAEEGFLLIVQELLSPNTKLPTQDLEFNLPSNHDQKQWTTPISLIEREYTKTPLQLAARKGNVEIVRILLSADTNHNVEDSSIALYYACQNDTTAIVKMLLSHVPVETVKDEWMNNPLHKAAEGVNSGILKLLLKSRRFNVDETNESGWTALHKAARVGNIQMVEMLLNAGADVNQRTLSQQTPLHIAADEGHLLIVCKLSDFMEDPELKDEHGFTSFSLAAAKGHVGIITELLSKSYFPLHRQSILQSEMELKIVLRCGFDINKVDKDNRTALHLEIGLGCSQAVKMLLAAGADRNIKDSRGKTPLYLAAKDDRDRVDIIQMLLEPKAAADINAEANNGATPIYAACFKGNSNIVKELLKHKPDVNLSNNKGWTPLHAAFNNADITRMLLMAGCRIDSVTNDVGSTALAMAAFCEQYYLVVKHHLDFGADPFKPDYDGDTAVHRAIEGGSHKSLQLMLEHKDSRARIDIQRCDGCTLLHLAAKDSEYEMAKMLLEKGANPDIESRVYGTVLMAAACAGAQAVADLLFLKREIDVNAFCMPYGTALQAAAFHGNLSMVEWLLSKGAKVNESRGEFGTALRASFVRGNASLYRGKDHYDKIAKVLLDAGSDPNDSPKDGKSILRLAIEHVADRVVGQLIQKGANADNEPPGNEALVLAAAKHGLFETLDTLLKYGANFAARDKYGRSLLSTAILTKKPRLVSLLLQREDIVAQINDKDHSDRTALILAVMCDSTDLEELLQKDPDSDVQDSEGKTALIYACIFDSKKSVELLLKDSDPTITDFRGRGALYWACRQASPSIFKLILLRLRDYDNRVYTSQSCQAIHVAVATNRVTILKTLLKNKDICPNKPGVDGWTAILIAEQYDYPHLTSLLHDAGFTEDKDAPDPTLPSEWSSTDKIASLKIAKNGQGVKVGGEFEISKFILSYFIKSLESPNRF